LGSALLTGSAIFYSSYQAIVLAAIMLIYPALDKKWKFPTLKYNYPNILIWIIIIALTGIFSLSETISIKLILTSLILTAIPEEWFFRAYIQTQLENYLKNKRVTLSNSSTAISIITASLFFASIHVIVQNNIILLPAIFFPSLFFGYLFYKTQDIVLVILTHLISNIFLYWIIGNNLLSQNAS